MSDFQIPTFSPEDQSMPEPRYFNRLAADVERADLAHVRALEDLKRSLLLDLRLARLGVHVPPRRATVRASVSRTTRELSLSEPHAAARDPEQMIA
jgi:hypothetical protein